MSVRLRRGKKLRDAPLPTSLVPGRPYPTNEQRAALPRLATGTHRHAAEIRREHRTSDAAVTTVTFVTAVPGNTPAPTDPIVSRVLTAMRVAEAASARPSRFCVVARPRQVSACDRAPH